MLQVFQLCCCCCSLTLFLCRDIYGMSQEERLRCKSFSCDVVLLDSFCVENAACAVALPYRLLRALFCLLATSIPPG